VSWWQELVLAVGGGLLVFRLALVGVSRWRAAAVIASRGPCCVDGSRDHDSPVR